MLQRKGESYHLAVSVIHRYTTSPTHRHASCYFYIRIHFNNLFFLLDLLEYTYFCLWVFEYIQNFLLHFIFQHVKISLWKNVAFWTSIIFSHPGRDINLKKNIVLLYPGILKLVSHWRKIGTKYFFPQYCFETD